MAKSGSGAPRRRYVRFTRWRRRRFFALLEETGCVRLACELSGVGMGCIYRLRRTEPGFVARMAAAVAAADARLALRDAGSAMMGPPSRCPGDGAAPSSPAPQGERDNLGAPLPDAGEGDLVIRRGKSGRLRMMAAGLHWWGPRADAVFLGHLRMSGNAAASARAAGFTPKSAWNRRERLPSFERAWDAALDEAQLRLDGRLVAEALKGTWGMEPGVFEAPVAETFDVDQALRLLTHWERRRAARHGPRRSA
jgi:hypothetical protein